MKNVFLLYATGHCMANEHYIGQLKETFATSMPTRIAGFFGEPIQVQYSCHSSTKKNIQLCHKCLELHS